MTLFTDIPKYKLLGNYKKGKIEKGFEAEMFKKLRKDQYICYHVADIGYSYKFLDCHIVSPIGELGWIEFKKINIDTFNVSQFEESQIVLMKELDRRNPNICRVMIFSVKNNDYVTLRFSEIRNNKNEKGGIKLWNKGKKIGIEKHLG